jgi:hypothetical protein
MTINKIGDFATVKAGTIVQYIGISARKLSRSASKEQITEEKEDGK